MMKLESSNEVAAIVWMTWKTNTDFGISIWNMKYICLFWFHASNHQYLEIPFSEDPSRDNIVNEPKHYRNMDTSTFNLFNDQFEGTSSR